MIAACHARIVVYHASMFAGCYVRMGGWGPGSRGNVVVVQRLMVEGCGEMFLECLVERLGCGGEAI